MEEVKIVPLLEKGKTTREICVVSEEKFAEYCKKLEGYEDSANYDFNTKWIKVSDVVNCLKERNKEFIELIDDTCHRGSQTIDVKSVKSINDEVNKRFFGGEKKI